MRYKLLLSLAILGLIVFCIPAVDAQNSLPCPLPAIPTLNAGLVIETPIPVKIQLITVDQVYETYIKKCSTEPILYDFEGQKDEAYTVLINSRVHNNGLPCASITSAEGETLGLSTPTFFEEGRSAAIINYVVLPKSGSYKIKIEPCNSSGFYTLQVVKETVQTIIYDTIVTATVDRTQKSAAYSFDGLANDEIYIKIEPSNSGFQIELYCLPRGACGNDKGLLPNNFGQGIANIPLRLPITGKYLIIVKASAPFSTNTFSVLLLNPLPIQYGDTVEAEFDVDEPLESYHFEAHSGDIVQLHVESNGLIDTGLAILKDQTMLLFDDDSGIDYDPEIIYLPIKQDGEYTIIFQPLYFVSRGKAKLTLTTTTNRVELGEEVQYITINSKENTAIMSFMGYAKETVTISILNITNNSGMPRLTVTQNGSVITEVFQTGGTGSSATFEIPENGIVSVTIYGNSPTPTVFEVSVRHADKPPQS